MESADNDDNDAAIHNEVFSSLIHQLTIHVIAVSCVYLMGPEGLEPPPNIWAMGLMQYISPLNNW